MAFVDCGDYHSLAVTTSGEVFGWGSNANGQLARLPSEASSVLKPQRLAPFP
ncbi:MAG: RCC1-like domain-containing protein, partial [Runella zeae]